MSLDKNKKDAFSARIDAMCDYVNWGKEEDYYFYFQPVDKLENAWVHVGDERKLMFATYSYLGLLQHPEITAAAQAALAKYGTGTHGVRMLGGTIDLHNQLEKRIATFTQRDDAIVFSSGYVTNLSTISTLVGPKDWVISDKLNHASIVDGCLLSRAVFKRYRHNDMKQLEKILQQAPDEQAKLVVADAVFSMDGDIMLLPETVALCQKYGARLMVDEAHSLGILGANGTGIEEHFNMPGSIDIRMGTLSKTIPAIGGYVSGDADLIRFLRHSARGFIFSAALPPAVAAAALEAINIIERDGAVLRKRLMERVTYFLTKLKDAGFDTGETVTPIIPIMIGDEEQALLMTRHCHQNGVFALPVIPPAVAPGKSRLRVNVTASHTFADIDFAVAVFVKAAIAAKILP